MPHYKNYIYGQIVSLHKEYWAGTMDTGADTSAVINTIRVVEGLHRILKKKHIKNPIRRTAIRCVLVPLLMKKYFPRVGNGAITQVLSHVNSTELKGGRVSFSRRKPDNWMDKFDNSVIKERLKRFAILKPYAVVDRLPSRGTIDTGVIKPRKYHFRSSKLRKMFKAWVKDEFKQGQLKEKGVGYAIKDDQGALSYQKEGDKKAKHKEGWALELWREP